jgi:hypothetical protein
MYTYACIIYRYAAVHRLSAFDIFIRETISPAAGLHIIIILYAVTVVEVLLLLLLLLLLLPCANIILL